MNTSGTDNSTARGVVFALSCVLASTAAAGDPESVWISNAQGSWFEPDNWVNGLLPEAGRNVRFGTSGFENPLDEVDIDNSGNGIVQSNDVLIVVDKVRFFDGSAGDDPTLADDGLIFDSMRLDGQGGEAVIVDVPITARLIRTTRHGAVFNREITVTEILAESEHQNIWQIKAGATGPISRILLDENRGPDGDTIDGTFGVDSDLTVDLFQQVWGRLRVGAEASMNITDFVHHNYRDEPEFSNINPIRIDGTLNVTNFYVRSVTTQSNTTLPPGTYGGIGHPSADFEQDFISGPGLLIVNGDRLFNDRFEPVE